MTASILELTADLLRRPLMYTARGSFAEIAAFINGYVSGAARVNYNEPLVVEWTAFEDWLTQRITASSSGGVLVRVLDAHGEAAFERLSEYLAEYSRHRRRDVP